MNNKRKHGNFLITLIIILVVDVLFFGYYAIQNHNKKNGSISNIIAVAEAPVNQSETIFLK